MERNMPPWIETVIPRHVFSIPPYVPGKPVEELQRESGIHEATKMASNENPLGPSPLAVKAMKQHAQNVHIYPESSAPELREAIAERNGISPDMVILGNGSDEIMALVAHVFMGPGQDAVMGAHCFSMYRIVTEAFGGEAIRIPLTEDYRFDLPAMSRAISDRTRLAFLAIPNSPTGTIVSRAEFEHFLRGVAGRKMILVIDEAYREYVVDSDCPNGLEFLSSDLPILVLRTFSKVYGLAGLRVGYGMASPWLIDLLNRVRPPFNVNSMAQKAAMAALNDTEHVQRSVRMTREGIDFLTTSLEALGLRVIRSQANFVTFCLAGNARSVYEGLLRYGVIVRHLASFGMDRCIRVTVGTEAQNLRFLNALRAVVEEVGGD